MSYTKTQWNNDTAPAINDTNLNKIEQGIFDNDSHIGDLSDLETTANTDLVSAINEVDSHADTNATNIGDLTTLTTTAKSNIVSAINELDSDKLEKAGGTISGGLTVSGDLSNKQFDLFNDTSGADWKAFLKNKIDYCIANMNTTKPLTSTFINGGWSGVTYGNGICTKIYTTYTLTWFGFKGTYFCLYDGNSYQYFVLGGNNYYTNEDVIGRWTNGKPIYRIVVPTTGNNNVTQKVAEISNMDTLITAKCYVKNGSTTRIVGSVWSGSLGWASQIYSPNGSDITIECGGDFTAFKNGASIYTTIEYTKTTD